jgi:hypothetical protein
MPLFSFQYSRQSEQARLYDSKSTSSTTDLQVLGFNKLSWILRFCIILVSTINYKSQLVYKCFGGEGLRVPLTLVGGVNQPIFMALDELGYSEIEINLWVKKIDDLCIFHDFRSGKRHSYGYKNNKSINIKNTIHYKIVKLIELSEGVVNI